MIELRSHHCIVPMVRYSDGQNQRELSNESQLDAIGSAINRAGHNPYVPFSVRAAHSGRDPNRAQLKEALDRIKAYNRNATQPITLLLLSKWDRWFRNAMASVEWVNRFKEIGVEVNTIDRWCFYTSANDLIMFFIEQCTAQNFSDDLSKHTIRNQEACIKRGYIPYQVRRRYLERHINKDNRWLSWKPASDNLRKAGQMILLGSGLNAAYQATGGREVHGAYQSFRDSLADEKMQARHKGYDLDYKPLWPEYEWQDLQRILSRGKVVTSKTRSLMDAYLRDILIGGPCNSRATSSTPKTKAKKIKGKYYTCRCKGCARHYRFKRDQVHEDFKAMLKEICLTANRQASLSKKAVKRSEDQLKNLKKSKARLEKQVKQGQEMKDNARRLLIQGVISAADRDATENETRVAEAELARVTDQINRYGEILNRVLDSIRDIGKFLHNFDNPLQLRDFTRVLFPDGLKYDAEKRLFRTTSINAAYSVIAEKSVSYNRIKFGEAIGDMTPPVVGAFPVLVRTPQSDRQLLRSYTLRYDAA